MRKPSVHGGKWKSNDGIDNIANGPVNNMSFFMLSSDRWYVFKHCGRPNHLSKCAWNLNCHCGRKACSSTSPHYGNCHYGTSHGGIISLCNAPRVQHYSTRLRALPLLRGRGNNSLQPSFFSSHGCIYTKMAVSTSSMILCLSCHVTWIELHAWLHYGISIKAMYFDHCQ